MTRKQKQELGILPRQIFSRVRDLKKSGVLESDMSINEVAVLLALDAASQEQTHDAWEALPYGSPDWDAILDFIERLLAIILPLFM